MIYLHDQGMTHGDLKGVGLLDSVLLFISNTSSTKANILIDDTGHACLADFGLVTIISDATSLVSSSQFAHGGTYRWMSPELFHQEDFGLKDSRRTKYSDCYALGMVIYEVLSGQVPFSRYHSSIAVTLKVVGGERPERPEGAEGKWFTDVVWGILEHCWAPEWDDRPSIEDVLKILEEASMFWTPISPRVVEGLSAMDSPICSHSDLSTEESMGKSEVHSLTPSKTLPQVDADNNGPHPSSGGSPGLLYQTSGHQDLRADVKNPKRSESMVIPDRVGGTGLLDGFWC